MYSSKHLIDKKRMRVVRKLGFFYVSLLGCAIIFAIKPMLSVLRAPRAFAKSRQLIRLMATSTVMRGAAPAASAAIGSRAFRVASQGGLSELSKRGPFLQLSLNPSRH